jgi:hypothetical protein
MLKNEKEPNIRGVNIVGSICSDMKHDVDAIISSVCSRQLLALKRRNDAFLPDQPLESNTIRCRI